MMNSIEFSEFDNTKQHLLIGYAFLDKYYVKTLSTNASENFNNLTISLESHLQLINLKWVYFNKKNYIALCLNTGSVHIYDFQTKNIYHEINLPKQISVTDFIFSDESKTSWICNIKGDVYEWDFEKKKILQCHNIDFFSENGESLNRIATIIQENEVHLILASQTVYLYNPSKKNVVSMFTAHILLITSIKPLYHKNWMFLTCVKGERFINLYHLETKKVQKIYTSQYPVRDFSFEIDEYNNILVVLNENNSVEIHNNFLLKEVDLIVDLSERKKTKKNKITPTYICDSSFSLSRPLEDIRNPNDDFLNIVCIGLFKDLVFFSWIDNSENFFFDSLNWINQKGEYTLTSEFKIFKSRNHLNMMYRDSHGHDITAPKLYHEGHATVSDGSIIRDKDSIHFSKNNYISLKKMLEKSNLSDNVTTTTQSKKTSLKESINSMSSILTQSLKSSDTQLLKTVLSTNNLETIKKTIENLNPSFALLFLKTLSDKIEREPTKFKHYIVWIKWIIIIHGSLLVSLDGSIDTILSLDSILTKQANFLPSFLEIQSRINTMFDAVKIKKKILIHESSDQEKNKFFNYIESSENDLSN